MMLTELQNMNINDNWIQEKSQKYPTNMKEVELAASSADKYALKYTSNRNEAIEEKQKNNLRHLTFLWPCPCWDQFYNLSSSSAVFNANSI